MERPAAVLRIDMTTSLSVLLLCAVLLAASMSKLAHWKRAREDLVAFGWPSRLRQWSVMVPLVEAAVALTLLPPSTRQWGLAAALCLHVALTAVVGLALRRGRRIACACLGSVSRRQVGWDVALLNVALALLAAVAMVETRHSRPVADIAAVLIGAGALVAFTRGARAETSLGPGSIAPHFHLPRSAGGSVALDSLLARGRPVLIVFSQAGCRHCQLVAALVVDQARCLDRHTLVWITSVDDRGSDAARLRQAGVTIAIDAGNRISARYQCRSRPAAVLVGLDGRLVEAPAIGRDEVCKLIGTLVTPGCRQPSPALTSG